MIHLVTVLRQCKWVQIAEVEREIFAINVNQVHFKKKVNLGFNEWELEIIKLGAK